jgi:capsular polysaccharide biosynthesis protein
LVLDLWSSLGILRRRWWIVLLVAATAAAVAVVYARMQAPVFRSAIRLEVSARFDNGQQLALERQLPQLAQRVRTTDVAREVDQRLKLDLGPQAVLDRLRAEAVVSSGQIQIEADDVDQARVEAIVLETARVFEEQHAARNQGIPTQDRAIVSILDRPTPARLVWPQTRVIVGAAVLLGLMVGALLALVIDHLDDTLKSAADVERALGTITLGRIPPPLVLLTSQSIAERAGQRTTERAR